MTEYSSLKKKNLLMELLEGGTTSLKWKKESTTHAATVLMLTVNHASVS